MVGEINQSQMKRIYFTHTTVGGGGGGDDGGGGGGDGGVGGGKGGNGGGIGGDCGGNVDVVSGLSIGFLVRLTPTTFT